MNNTESFIVTESSFSSVGIDDEKTALKSTALEKSIKRQYYFRIALKWVNKSVPVLFALMIILSAALISLKSANFVTINEDGQLMYQISTTSRTVEELFSEVGLETHPADIINVEAGDYLYRNAIINIEKAFPVFVSADKEVREIWTTGITVEELLKSEGYTLGVFDEVAPSGAEDLVAYDEVNIIRIEKIYTAQNTAVPYESVTRENPSLARGMTRVVTEGEEGVKKETVEIVYADGEEISREVVEEEIIESPKNEVVEKGTKAVVVAPTVSHGSGSSGSIGEVNFGRALTVSSTAYCTCTICTGSGNGITATGAPAIAGSGTISNPHVIAVDPRVIPLRSTVYIEGYGYARALDTGGAIKGNKVDLLFGSHQEALRFGRRTLKIHLVE